ncbi:hypothetical protein C8Q80DRAFT_1115802 [Daedaleopsis nitida]|nr:hypothetical protein C8Q80DRAFT_1115802 [Daedaleopsis nitida]
MSHTGYHQLLWALPCLLLQTGARMVENEDSTIIRDVSIHENLFSPVKRVRRKPLKMDRNTSHFTTALNKVCNEGEDAPWPFHYLSSYHNESELSIILTHLYNVFGNHFPDIMQGYLHHKWGFAVTAHLPMSKTLSVLCFMLFERKVGANRKDPNRPPPVDPRPLSGGPNHHCRQVHEPSSMTGTVSSKQLPSSPAQLKPANGCQKIYAAIVGIKTDSVIKKHIHELERCIGDNLVYPRCGKQPNGGTRFWIQYIYLCHLTDDGETLEVDGPYYKIKGDTSLSTVLPNREIGHLDYVEHYIFFANAIEHAGNNVSVGEGAVAGSGSPPTTEAESDDSEDQGRKQESEDDSKTVIANTTASNGRLGFSTIQASRGRSSDSDNIVYLLVMSTPSWFWICITKSSRKSSRTV